MTHILALETSSTVCSVALYQEERLLGLAELQIEKSHSSHITILINQLLQNCNVTLPEVSAVAVSGGPGSYTGLRIGSATAKGLCYALNIPLIEISTLHAMAYNLIRQTPVPEKYLFCPMLDARRMEVYTCLLDAELQEHFPVTPVILNETSFQEYTLKQPVIFFGNGAAKFRPLVGHHSQALFVVDTSLSARPVGALALAKFNQQQFEDVAYYEPYYLKEVHITASTKANL